MPNPYSELLDRNGWRLAGLRGANNPGLGPYAQLSHRHDPVRSARAILLHYAEALYEEVGSGFNAGDNPYRFAINDLAAKGLDNNVTFDALHREWESELSPR